MRKYRVYTDDDIIRYSREVYSIAGLLKKLDLKPVGGNYANIKRNLQRLSIDTSHWTGQAWCKDARMKDWSQYARGREVKKHLVRERGHRCESCRLDEWLNQLIALEIHHIDGCKTNNAVDNLQLLCPNCHAFTGNYRKPNWIK